MNGQLAQIDQDLRAHLARRSAGPLPEGLADQVLQAIDVAPVQPRYAWRTLSPRRALAVPQALLAGAGLAAVVLLVAALAVVPRFQMTPAASGLAGYPADRALSTAELASLMAGPALPTNTALVADVVIDIRTDVCPMDRYGTVGIVEGMASQVCVMTASEALIQPVTIRGIMAFRYLAPGVLGLLGEITPASSAKVAFHVADEWPLQGKTFLVDGWLGAEGLLESCAQAPTSGDVLMPDGEDCPYDDWLSDDTTAPGIQADHEYSPPSPLPSYDPLSLRGNARHVEAGGMRLIDSVDHAAPVHGVYVVRSVTEGCPGDPPQSSRGCGVWRVLAKVADISLPTVLASPSASPMTWPSGYPIDRALTTDELGRLLDSGALKTYDTVLVDNPSVSPSTSCPKIDASYPVDGSATVTIDGLDPQVCLYSATTHGMTPGKMVLRMLGERMFGYMATITAPPTSQRLAYTSSDIWPQDWFLVHGWLDTDARDCGPTAVTSGAVKNPMLPIGYGTMCHAALTATRFDPGSATGSGPTPAGPPRILSFDVPNDGRPVDSAPFFTVAGGDPQTGSIEGTYLVLGQLQCSTYGSTDCEQSIVLARLTDVALQGSTPLPTGTSGAPATPLSPSLTGVIGTANQPFKADELETLMVEQSDHLAGRIVIVEAPIPTQISCQSDANGGGCAVNTAPLAGDGVWAVSIGADGTLSLVGQMDLPQTSYIFTLDQTQATWTASGDRLFLVDAWIGGAAEDSCDVSRQPCYEVSWLGATPDGQQVKIQLGAYHLFGGGPVGGGPAIHGVFLIQTKSGTAEVVARMETAAP